MAVLTLDELGRLLIPEEIREQLGVTSGTEFTLVVQDGKLILEPLSQESKVYYSGTVLVVESEANRQSGDGTRRFKGRTNRGINYQQRELCLIPQC
jgi:AbrB family looped-hinge helix DNA binding protein